MKNLRRILLTITMLFVVVLKAACSKKNEYATKVFYLEKNGLKTTITYTYDEKEKIYVPFSFDKEKNEKLLKEFHLEKEEDFSIPKKLKINNKEFER